MQNYICSKYDNIQLWLSYLSEKDSEGPEFFESDFGFILQGRFISVSSLYSGFVFPELFLLSV